MQEMLATRPELDRVVPGFSLPSLDGRAIGPSSYKQRANLVMLFFDPGRCGECLDFLREAAGNYAEYRDLETRILAICPVPESELRQQVGSDLPFPVLSDADRRVTDSYLSAMELQPAAAVFITDRYGALRDRIFVGQGEQVPREEILGWLRLIETECPECGE